MRTFQSEGFAKQMQAGAGNALAKSCCASQCMACNGRHYSSTAKVRFSRAAHHIDSAVTQIERMRRVRKDLLKKMPGTAS
jgi:hypothetical protein